MNMQLKVEGSKKFVQLNNSTPEFKAELNYKLNDELNSTLEEARVELKQNK